MKGSSAARVSVYVFGSVVVLEPWKAAGFGLPVGQIGSLLIDFIREHFPWQKSGSVD